PVYIGATVAPHRRSLKAKLHTISNPGRRDLMPLLNKPMMTITLDTKRKMLSNNKKSKCGIFLIAPSPFDPSLTCGFEIWHFIVPVRIKEDFGRTRSLFHVGKELSPAI
ncbi:unnamed protein product, partial [Porites lobata]